MTTIEEIKKLSEAGSIDDPDKAEAILNDFAHSKMGPLFACTDPMIRDLYDNLAGMWGFYPAIIDELSYLELIWMLDNLENVRDIDWTSTPAQCERTFMNFLKKTLLDAGNTDPTVKCFLAVKLETLNQCLDKRKKDHSFELMWAKYSEMLNWAKESGGDLSSEEGDIRFMLDLTIGRVLELTNQARTRSWNGWNNADPYIQMINTSYEVDLKLLKNVILELFPKEIDDLDPYQNYFEYFNPGSLDEDDLDWDVSEPEID